jgi:type II secretory ATPase GspE/PulE/Tfp pilus assembly ATPase PilB-like protein
MKEQQPPTKVTGTRPRGVQLCLRDQALVDGLLLAAEGTHLPSVLGNRKGWVNLTNVHFLNTGEKLPHIAVQTNRILWAASPNQDITLLPVTQGASSRSVEIQLEGGVVLRGDLSLAQNQRLSDYVGAFGDFIPLRDARLLPGGHAVGDVAVNREAIERLREIEEDGTTNEIAAAFLANNAQMATEDLGTAVGDVAAAEPAWVPTEPTPEVNRVAANAVPPAPDDRTSMAAPPRDTGTHGRHWLCGVARASRLKGAESFNISASQPILEAWRAVTDFFRLTDDELARMVAGYFRLGLAEFDKSDASLASRIPEKITRKYNVLPLREENGHLVLATSDPTDHDAEQALRFASRKRPIFEIATPTALKSWINTRHSSDHMVQMLLSTVDADLGDAVKVVEDSSPESVGDEDIDAAPIIKLTNVILRDAIREGASDIHLEPGGAGAVVRFRVDGVLRHHMQIPVPALNRVVSRIKILADLDIADRLRPQDGRTRIQVDGRKHDLRVSTVPTRGTEKLVIRVLQSEGTRSLADIGAPEWELSRIRQLLSYRDGITVVTGPTGSGKTTTLYAALREVATGEVNVMSVEDPVEYELQGITQIQVEPVRGVTFANALRAILRQDPDVIFVGEIRDPETAEVAVHASMTGHLVLATLHTNDAVSAVARFAHLGVDATSIASTLRGAVAQRLLRRLCTQCAEPVNGELTTEEARLATIYGVEPMFRARGCKRCGQAGFRGRLPLVEVMTVTPAMQDLIIEKGSQAELFRAAVANGMRPLLRVALERVRAGETSLQEVERVIGGVKEDVGVTTGLPAALAAQLQSGQSQYRRQG